MGKLGWLWGTRAQSFPSALATDCISWKMTGTVRRDADARDTGLGTVGSGMAGIRTTEVYGVVNIYWAAGCSMLCLMLASPLIGAGASTNTPPEVGSAKQIVATMLANEDAAAQHKGRYAYLSKERSDRTGGHLWTEKLVETSVGKVRMLLQEDGQPLSAERISQERGRLAGVVADPAAFQRKEQALKDDEAHARTMLTLLPKAFLFDDVREQDGEMLIDFRPNPDYEPQSLEERVLHGMSGSMMIDAKSMRLHHIEGRMPTDVSIGFGLLATIHAGSSFATSRDPTSNSATPEWKTTLIDSAIDGRAILFKAIARNEHAEHSNFIRVADDLSVAQAVAIAEQ
jgi:hypothetical protein